jgi:uncharacterized membrane protein YfcA
MFEPVAIVVIAGAFLIGGTVKGVIGLGLPSVSLALLAVTIDLTSAMALIVVPTFVTNVWQAIVGGNGKVILVRLWLFFLMAALTVWIGAIALTRVDLSWLSALLGLLLIIYSAVNLIGFRFKISTRHEVWLGPLLGAVNGVLMGMTGSAVVPGVMYLQSIGLSRDMLIQAMGMLFMVSTFALAIALQQNAILTVEHSMISIAALVPGIIGMILGQQIRHSLSEALFRKVLFVSLLALGIYIIINAITTRI